MKKHSLFLSIILVFLWCLASYAMIDVECFSNTYTRGKGKPFIVTDSVFSAHQGDGEITIINGYSDAKRITSARIWLNGVLICVPDDWNDNVASLVKPVTLKEGENKLEVLLYAPQRGKISLAVTQELAEGESHAKPLDWSKVVWDYYSGNQIVNDQITVMLSDLAYLDSFKNLIADFNGVIAGHIADTGGFQIEIKGDIPLENLLIIADLLNENPNILVAGTNKILNFQAAITPPNDLEWNTGEPGDVWNEFNPKGTNWRLEAIYVPSAWDQIYNDTEQIPGDTDVKIGIPDGGFNADHEDLNIPDDHHHRLSSNGDIMNRSTDSIVPGCPGPPQSIFYNHHGTISAGIIGANSNNWIGITGIMWEKDLYVARVDTDFDWWTALRALLIDEGVQIINISMGIGWRDGCTLCTDNSPPPCPTGDPFENPDIIENRIRTVAYLSTFDVLFKNKYPGKDFLIIQAAGNQHIDNRWNGYCSSLINSDEFIYGGKIKDRCLVVGSINQPVNCPSDCSYTLSNFSNYGNIDLVAPGSNIYSTLAFNPFYGETWTYEDTETHEVITIPNSGNSYAAPHVAGVAGLVWNLYPDFSASDVRDIIVKTADRKFWDNTNPDNTNYEYKILNAKAAVNAVLAPKVSAFEIDPTTLTEGESLTANYTVTDNQDLERVELWRAPSPTGPWTEVDRVENINGTSADSSDPNTPALTDTPDEAGTYWYGLHVVDEHLNCTTEENKDCTSGAPNGGPDLGPIMVTVNTQPQIDVQVGGFSANGVSGYRIEFYAQDPNHLADSMTVTGPGIVTPIPLTFEAILPGEWWSDSYIDFGSSPPDPPLTYTFHILSDGIEYTYEWLMESFVHEFATNLSPSGSASGDITFTWTGVSIPEATYFVQFYYESGGDWNSPHTTGNSITYGGEPLTPGTSYSYCVVTNDSYGNFSFACANFVYEPLPLSPYVSVSPSSGPQGTTFSQPGSGFTPNSTATLYFNGPDGPSTVNDKPTLSDGSYSHSWTCDNCPVGTYSYYAVDDATGTQSNTVNFSVYAAVNPQVNVSPSSGPQGTTFSQPGSGFTPNSTATLYFNGPDGPSTVTDKPTLSDGSYSHSWTCDNCPVGTYSYYAVDDATSTPSNTVNFSVYADDFPVLFPDPNLEAAIREAISKPTDDIMYSDLQGLTSLNAYDRGITDLEGLQYCSNLSLLLLHSNQITNLNPLAGLVNLSSLIIADNQITDISPLAGLVNLTDLALYTNQITDISPLAGLTNLSSLSLFSNQITDISPLAGLVNLTILWMYSNQITDINPLAGLLNLTHLYLSNNQITDISPLAGLVNLTDLDLASNQITDIRPLAGLLNLTHLYLSTNQISDISPLAGLTNLTLLLMSVTQISDISPLAGLVNLSILGMSRNQITDISPLAGLVNLTDLALYTNQITDISPLVSNSGIGSGDTVDLRRNLLDSTSCTVHIPDLISRGANVIHDCPTINPTVSVSPSSGPQGTTFSQPGSGFMPNSTATLYFNGPDGPSTVTDKPTLSDGSYSHSWTCDNCPVGTYSYYAVDDATSTPSNTVNFSVYADDFPVLFPDPNLEAAIREAISKPEPDDIMYSDLQNLRYFSANVKEIEDIEGIQYCKNLIELSLMYNEIDNITPLAGLVNLTYLGLRENQISNITPLASLVNLTYLNFGYNQISDITPLAGLVNLTELYIYGNEISDISPLSGLTNLYRLEPAQNPISDISPIAGLSNLEILELGGCQIGDLPPLAGLSNLKYLSMGDNPLSDISQLAELSNLTTLILQMTPVTDILPLEGLVNLEVLAFGWNQIRDISPLAGLVNLNHLVIIVNQISDISPLVSNSGIGSGDFVSLGSNPLSITSCDTYIPELISRGADVDYDCPPISPMVQVSPTSGPIGTLFSEPGYGFWPFGDVTLHFIAPPPDGTHYDDIVKTADEFGNYTHTYQSDSDTAIGTWEYYAVDDTTGYRSNSVYFTIEE